MMFDLPELEKEARKRWSEEGTFLKSLDPSKEAFHLLEGPPTMNGTPGVHHVEARAFKDLFARYKTMRGYYVPRRAGWDCHGLPVELSVAEKLGLKGRQAVLDYGLEAFNRECRSSVQEHQRVFEKLTELMGYWVDMENPWRTMDNSYVETMWSALKTMHERSLLRKHYRVSPWCTSCSSTLSSHEVAQGAGTSKDPAVTVMFEVPELDACALAWTTTPWTLAENLLLGVDPDGVYKLTRTSDGTFLTSSSFEVEGQEVGRLSGRELDGLRYLPLLGEPRGDAFKLVAADFVKADAGTGLVHLAPAYGKDDFALAESLGLEFEVGLDPDGKFSSGPFTGLGVDEVTGHHLLELGVKVYSQGEYEHERAHCWRCKTPLVDLARPSWFLETTKVRAQMLDFTDQTSWLPGEERFRRWVEGNVDWALTRERFWGTPLPVWTCPEGHVQVVGSRLELASLSGRDLADLDLHRPYVDDVTFTCHCGQLARREEEVLDTWFDSGAAPLVVGQDCSDLVAEGVDQTRGWFYTLSAVAALLGKPQPFKNVLSLGLVLDAKGEKMSKSKGNVVDPFDLFERYGADAVRWSLLVDGDAWSARRFDEKSVKTSSAFFAKAWACLGALRVDNSAKPGTLELWLESRLSETVQTVTEALEGYQSGRAGAALEVFVEDLSTRYLRSRRASLSTEGAALVVESLLTLSKLLAPFAPHYAEALHEACGGVASVHLQVWPSPAPRDDEVLRAGSLLWSYVDEARSQRAKARIRLRQPLQSATLSLPVGFPSDLVEVFKQQANVKGVHLGVLDVKVKPNWRSLGTKLGKDAPAAAKALEGFDGEVLLFETSGTSVALLLGEDFVRTQSQGCTLNLELTDALKREGDAADLLRRVVDARKEASMAADDTVEVWFTDPADLALASEFESLLALKNCSLSPSAKLVL